MSLPLPSGNEVGGRPPRRERVAGFARPAGVFKGLFEPRGGRASTPRRRPSFQI